MSPSTIGGQQSVGLLRLEFRDRFLKSAPGSGVVGGDFPSFEWDEDDNMDVRASSFHHAERKKTCHIWKDPGGCVQ